MIQIQERGTEAWWTETGAEEWADAIVAAMKLGGIDNLFFVSGSELTFYQEAIAKAHARGRPAPRLVTMTHEHVALNAALGNAMVRNQPAATAVHVDVGTLHYGAAIHTAWRGGYPVLMTAAPGRGPFPARCGVPALAACSGSRSLGTRARSYASTPDALVATSPLP